MASKKAAGQTFTRQGMTHDLAHELIAQHKTIAAAARAILPYCSDRDDNKPSFTAVRKWIQEALAGGLARSPRITDASRADRANQVLNLLDEAGIELDSIKRIDQVKVRSGFHEVITKDKDGNPVVTRSRSKNTALLLSPKWEDGPEWPVVQAAKPVAIKTTIRPRPKSTTKTIVVLSDLQVGFLRNVDDFSTLTPMHDAQAIDVALQITADLQPDQIGYVGDFLDLNEMSRWLQVEEFTRTTQPAIDEGYKILAKFEAAAGPRSERDATMFVAGNHDRRLREYIQKNARAAFNLRPAQSTPSDWPDLTVPRLLRFDELGIKYVGEYPGGEWWITDQLVVRHNPAGSSAYAGSVIAGHTHKVKRDTFSRRTPMGPVHSTIYEIGCLCRLDKYADHKSLMATSVPSDRGFVKDWAHGFAVVSVAPDGVAQVEQVDYIAPGRAIFRGREYTAASE